MILTVVIFCMVCDPGHSFEGQKPLKGAFMTLTAVIVPRRTGEGLTSSVTSWPLIEITFWPLTSFTRVHFEACSFHRNSNMCTHINGCKDTKDLSLCLFGAGCAGYTIFQ